jgi:hypothetical protein
MMTYLLPQLLGLVVYWVNASAAQEEIERRRKA